MTYSITYTYTPSDWSQRQFLELGGFTVVFLNYNKATYIEKSVASALAQDFPLCEMFFMDDASTDGSGDTMERLVREYRGPHKVTVVRNSINQRIPGQWNIVSKLATGNWLGMFCADDLAWSDRVSKAAKIVSENHDLLGFMTGGMEIRVCGGKQSEPVEMPHPQHRIVANGTTSLFDIADFRLPIVGATAWYHRSLFDKPLPNAPLDDLLLRWVLQARTFGINKTTWLWAGDVKTITYTSGVGVSTSMQGDVHKRRRRAQWIHDVETTKQFDTLLIRTWSAILEYYRLHGAPVECERIAKWALLMNRIICGNTFTRCRLLPAVISCVVSPHLEPKAKNKLFRAWMKFFVQFFFGTYIASYITTALVKQHENN